MKLTAEEQALADAYALIHKTDRLLKAIFNASAPVPLSATHTPERFKPGTRRVPHTPIGRGPRKTWAVS